MKNTYKIPELFQRLGLSGTNIKIFIAGLICILVGYIFLATGDKNSVWSLTVGPIMLVIGYVVLLPLSLAYKPKNKSLPMK
jgi:hypothetical protein